jgi:Polyketide cyclase / dehydrase and lipid transport
VTTISVTLSVQIPCPAAEAFRFIADPASMPQWAVHNVKSIRLVAQSEWEIQTPRGAGRLILHYDQASGILDHEFVDPKEGSWAVAARIVPPGAKDSVHMITLVRPTSMPEEAFRQAMPLVEEELETMRRFLDR